MSAPLLTACGRGQTEPELQAEWQALSRMLSCMGSSCLLHSVSAHAAVWALQVDVFSFACIMYELFARTVMSTTVSPLSFNPEACERYAMKVSMTCSLRHEGASSQCRALKLCSHWSSSAACITRSQGLCSVLGTLLEACCDKDQCCLQSAASGLP